MTSWKQQGCTSTKPGPPWRPGRWDYQSPPAAGPRSPGPASAPSTAICGTEAGEGVLPSSGGSSKLTSCTASCFLKESRRSDRCSRRMITSSEAASGPRQLPRRPVSPSSRSPEPSLSADWPRRSRRGERAGASGCPGRGDGERGGGADTGGQASGEGGILLVDLRRPVLWRGGPNLAARPCRELGRVWPVAGEAGLLEFGDPLGGDAVSGDDNRVLGQGDWPPYPPILPNSPANGPCVSSCPPINALTAMPSLPACPSLSPLPSRALH